MIQKALRLAGYIAVTGLAVWVGRLIAHSKVPPPEGRWREVTDKELGE